MFFFLKSVKHYANGCKEELAQLLPPYIALGFDQQIISQSVLQVPTMGQLQSIVHLSQYGQPLWNAYLPEPRPGDMVAFASWKLTDGLPFKEDNKHQIFALLSQRLCLDPVLVTKEAQGLADHSIAHHMRLLVGLSNDHNTFYTCSPSEPILALASADILYANEKRLGKVLNVFSHDLCSSGLVEKGLLGELGARTLLLIARDFAAPIVDSRRNLLQPVRLLDVLHTLFGTQTWANLHQQTFDAGFANAYVNFTHWAVTKDSLPEAPDQRLLANLWARGIALQCCFNQVAIDFMIPVYFGSIAADAKFDPANLSVVSVQVKYKTTSDPGAEVAIRPIGVPRDLDRPLPYLAMLLELDNESSYRSAQSQIKVAVSDTADGDFAALTDDWLAAEMALQNGQNMEENDTTIKKLKDNVKNKRLARDSHNRYSISVRGITPEVYGILKEANITTAFTTLFSATSPSSLINEGRTMQHMRPLERLGVSAHTEWMSKYGE